MLTAIKEALTALRLALELAHELAPLLRAYLHAKTKEALAGQIADREQALVEALDMGRADEVAAAFDAVDRQLDSLLPQGSAAPGGAGTKRDHAERRRDVDRDSGLDGEGASKVVDLRGALARHALKPRAD